MNLDIHICPTNLLTQKQLQEIADLTTFCHRHDGIELSYPVEEEHHTHFLGYLADGRLAACLTLISYEETLAECCAFTHPEFRRQGFFSRLLDEAVSQYPDVDLLFAVSEDCADAIKTLAALGAEKDSDEHMMACDLNSWHMAQQAGISDGTIASHPFSLTQTSETEYTLFAPAPLWYHLGRTGQPDHSLSPSCRGFAGISKPGLWNCLSPASSPGPCPKRIQKSHFTGRRR